MLNNHTWQPATILDNKDLDSLFKRLSRTPSPVRHSYLPADSGQRLVLAESRKHRGGSRVLSWPRKLLLLSWRRGPWLSNTYHVCPIGWQHCPWAWCRWLIEVQEARAGQFLQLWECPFIPYAQVLYLTVEKEASQASLFMSRIMIAFCHLVPVTC